MVIGSISINGLIPTGPTATAQQMFVKSRDALKPAAGAAPLAAAVQEADSCGDTGTRELSPTGAHKALSPPAAWLSASFQDPAICRTSPVRRPPHKQGTGSEQEAPKHQSGPRCVSRGLPELEGLSQHGLQQRRELWRCFPCLDHNFQFLQPEFRSDLAIF